MPDALLPLFSERIAFRDAVWPNTPNAPGVYVIYDLDELVYVGMAGRNGGGGLRNRLPNRSTSEFARRPSL